MQSTICNHDKTRSVDQVDRLLGFILGLLTLAVYIRTLVPGLVPNDGAEFQTLAYVLDHAHTTGYHVYLILARLFLILPVREIAYRVNLFSAFMGAVTIVNLYFLAKILSGSRWGALLCSITLGISTSFWSQAIIAEVYTSGTAYVSAILFLVVSWNQNRRHISLFYAGLLGGMSIGIHGSIILLFLAIMVLMAMNYHDFPYFWKPALAGAISGIIIFFMTFMIVDARETNASMMHTYISSISRWDMSPVQIDSLPERFTFLVLARQWRPVMFMDGALRENFKIFMRVVTEEFSLTVHFLAIFGFFSLWHFRPKLAVFFTIALVVQLGYTLTYGIGDIFVFFLPIIVTSIPICAEGVSILLKFLHRKLSMHESYFEIILSGILLITCLFPFAIPRVQALQRGEFRNDLMNLPNNDQLGIWHESIRYNVTCLPKNAVVLVDWYNIYAYAYSAHVELDRSDLLFIEAYPFAYNGVKMADSLLAYIDQKIINGHPIYTLWNYEDLLRGGFLLSGHQIGNTEMYLIEKN